jgi:hypothetical protein
MWVMHSHSPFTGVGGGLQIYEQHFLNPDGSVFISMNARPVPGAPNLLGTTPEIEELRPKSPPREEGGRGGRGGRGRRN